jgi:hypothetical protein
MVIRRHYTSGDGRLPRISVQRASVLKGQEVCQIAFGMYDLQINWGGGGLSCTGRVIYTPSAGGEVIWTEGHPFDAIPVSCIACAPPLSRCRPANVNANRRLPATTNAKGMLGPTRGMGRRLRRVSGAGTAFALPCFSTHCRVTKPSFDRSPLMSLTADRMLAVVA